MEVYLDNSATTKCYEAVGEIVAKVMCEDYGNPSSMHKKGVDAEKYVKTSKETLAKAQSEYDKAVKKDLLKKNTAARRKAKLHAIAKSAKVKLA